MDGVLVDFENGVVKAINQELLKKNPKRPKLAKKVRAEIGSRAVTVDDIKKFSDTSVKSVRNYMYALVRDDVNFWAKLKWTKDGRDLWNYIKKFNPYILTAPMDKLGESGSADGKILWVQKHLGKEFADRVIFEHDKWKHASDGNNPNILIDDFESKINPWKKAKGIGIHHLNAKTTKDILQDIHELMD
jgi:hypothetical protein